MQKPPLSQGIGASREGHCKNIAPWGVSFDPQVFQIPTYARMGGGEQVGLNIDRRIIASSLLL